MGTDMRGRTALAVLLMVGGIGAAGCIPPPTGGGTTTTVVPGTAGCYNATGHDLKYSGTPNVEGNILEHSTTNGSCGGTVVSSTGLLVVADGEPQANADCFALGRDNAIEFASLGVTMPADHWLCTES